MEIVKFRAYDTIYKSMSDWDSILNVDLKICFSDPTIVMMQFVGLYDLNNTEIYEGDILAYPDDEEEWKNGSGERMIVVFHDELARFGLDFYSIAGGEGYTGTFQNIHNYVSKCIIVGNIYQNEDILKSW